MLAIAELVVGIERGYEWLKRPMRRHVENVLRSWNIGAGEEAKREQPIESDS
jgi:hypothetical protein